MQLIGFCKLNLKLNRSFESNHGCYLFYFYRDRFRTMINVWGDSIGAGVVAHLSKKEIEDFNKHPENFELTEETNDSNFKPLEGENYHTKF